MTPEVKAIHDAADSLLFGNDEALADLINAVLALPLDQWPEGAGVLPQVSVSNVLTDILVGSNLPADNHIFKVEKTC